MDKFFKSKPGFLILEALLGLTISMIFCTIFCIHITTTLNQLTLAKEKIHACFLAQSFIEKIFLENNSENQIYKHKNYKIIIKTTKHKKLQKIKEITIKIIWGKQKIEFLTSKYEETERI